MRSSRFQLQSLARRWSVRRPSFTTLLVAASMAFGVAQWTVYAMTGQTLFNQDSLPELLGLSADTFRSGCAWQCLTFPLVHANALHLLGTAVPLYLAGREVEPIIGGKHFLTLFVLGNLLGGVAQWGVMASGGAPPEMIFVGMAAGAAAVVAAFATILPELVVTPLLVVPPRLRAKRICLGLLLLGAALWISQTATVIGPAAILTGTVFGWVYAKQLGFGNPLAIERYFLERRQHAVRLERMPAEQFIAEELDPVLEKLGRGGMGCLSRAEKRLLQQGSAKLAGKR